MRQSRLNDAAIALARAMSRAGIRFGIFGGYAITVLGGPRESKDIDCVAAAVTKQQILDVLDGRDGFVAVNQSRQDYVAFLWSDSSRRENAVLVEVFPEQFPGAQYTMNAPTRVLNVPGSNGSGSAVYFDSVYLFKGKLSAAATRAKFHDAADLRWLEMNFHSILAAQIDAFSHRLIGLGIQRYPELELPFERLGADVRGAKAAATAAPAGPSVPGDVQRALLWLTYIGRLFLLFSLFFN